MANRPLESDTTHSPDNALEPPVQNPTNLSVLLSPSSTLANDLASGDLHRPIRVVLVVYDLLPPGKLSNLAWLLGVGLYHSAVRIPELGREIAFGGHPHPQLSGVFSLPIRPDGKPPMPGLRLITSVDMGEVKTCTTPRSSKLSRASRSSLRDEEARQLIRSSTSMRSMRSSIQTVSSLQQSTSSCSGPAVYPPTTQDVEMTKSTSRDENSSASSLASSTSSSLPTRTQLETFVHILTQLEESPDWRGTSYDLLRRNCNTFTDEFCMLLTGRHTPSWINRAASVGSAFPCLVPDEWVEPPPAVVNPPPPSTPQSYGPPKQEMKV
ncbi:hypothetical protein CROQUDRAFT_652603 [Cronartium quercuum f. sp. fusiforme G11]|uniref:PPPDE domain-containing protein n=1 Tax=Cronartium quercuum f. sp. fusiforme G11 TaxID=708437 RepID=A0A9P6NQ78_9BASI|nr:hypothetical protein CROQUDRAFT_652603 [Cronartium quercuum f. sp. fusiforme G11]